MATRRRPSVWRKWAGLLLVVGVCMALEALVLSRRWQQDCSGQPRNENAKDAFSDTVCPEQAPCPSCDKSRQEKEVADARSHQAALERSLAQRDEDITSLKAAAKQRPHVQLANPQTVEKAVLIATPVKNAADKIGTYFSNLHKLTYPKDMISLGFIVSDSLDSSAKAVRHKVKHVQDSYRRATVIARDFGYQQAPDPEAKPNAEDEAYRRSILARSRNYLLAEALRDEGWVLWLDVDIVQYPPTLIETLLKPGAEIVTTNCVFVDDGGRPTDRGCEEGSWAETDASRAYLKTAPADKPLFESFGGGAAFQGSRLRLGNDTNRGKATVPLDAVGATTTLCGCTHSSDVERFRLASPAPAAAVAAAAITAVKAELHRDGLVFPPVLYDHQIEAEGFGKMAVAAGYQPLGLPGVIVHHAPVHLKPQPKWD